MPFKNSTSGLKIGGCLSRGLGGGWRGGGVGNGSVWEVRRRQEASFGGCDTGSLGPLYGYLASYHTTCAVQSRPKSWEGFSWGSKAFCKVRSGHDRLGGQHGRELPCYSGRQGSWRTSDSTPVAKFWVLDCGKYSRLWHVGCRIGPQAYIKPGGGPR